MTGVAPETLRERALNRDLSWLEFNARVLEEAIDARNPLMERVKFLAIFANNLDEFVMKRIALLRRETAIAPHGALRDGRTPPGVLTESRRRIAGLQQTQSRCWENEIRPALAEAGVKLLAYKSLGEADRAFVDAWFDANAFPVLTPLAVDPGHRFPFISNLSENFGVIVTSPDSPERRFARSKIPDVLPRFIELPRATEDDPIRFIGLEQVIGHNLDDLFPGMRLDAVQSFRVTRSAVVDADDEDVDDLLEHVEEALQMRRFANVVRLEVLPNPNSEILDVLSDALHLEPEDITVREGLLEWTDLFQLASVEPPPRERTQPLRYRPWTPVVPAGLGPDVDLFARIREGEVLLHHPYECFEATVQRLVSQAARDPDVLAIKQTIYRTSPDSPFVRALVRAAERGKQVACLVELQARFDEQKNVRFARQLEKAGVHVAYGVLGLKTHCKTLMVVRREGDGLRTYAHIGTGNYHPGTAKLYTDLGLMTCDPEITQDVVSLFNLLTGHSRKAQYNHLLVAPTTMRRGFYAMIEREIEAAREGRPARIIAKMNSMEDTAMTERLYAASAAGVPITLIVRGFCCLRPGVEGLSENIRVISSIGRFLEHSRVFHFANGEDDPARGSWYIGSGDWMYRNLSGRVEAAVPVRGDAAREKIWRLIDASIRDHRHGWELGPEGNYTQRVPPADAASDSPEVVGVFGTTMAETSASR